MPRRAAGGFPIKRYPITARPPCQGRPPQRSRRRSRSAARRPADAHDGSTQPTGSPVPGAQRSARAHPQGQVQEGGPLPGFRRLRRRKEVGSFFAAARPRVASLAPPGQFTSCTWRKIPLRPQVWKMAAPMGRPFYARSRPALSFALTASPSRRGKGESKGGTASPLSALYTCLHPSGRRVSMCCSARRIWASIASLSSLRVPFRER